MAYPAMESGGGDMWQQAINHPHVPAINWWWGQQWVQALYRHPRAYAYWVTGLLSLLPLFGAINRWTRYHYAIPSWYR